MATIALHTSHNSVSTMVVVAVVLMGVAGLLLGGYLLERYTRRSTAATIRARQIEIAETIQDQSEGKDFGNKKIVVSVCIPGSTVPSFIASLIEPSRSSSPDVSLHSCSDGEGALHVLKEASVKSRLQSQNSTFISIVVDPSIDSHLANSHETLVDGIGKAANQEADCS